MADTPEPYVGFDFPAAYAQGIAKIISYWSALEYNINLSIWHLAGVYPAIGACITEQIYTLDGRLKAIQSLLKLRRAPDDLLRKVNHFAETSHKAQAIRNRVAHDAWHQSDESKKMYQLTIGARGKLTYGFKPLSLADLELDRDEVQRAMRKAATLRDAIELSLPTLPEIPIGELHPTFVLSGGSEQTRSSDYRFVLFPPKPSPD
jgi:hypothetical protein